jgi:hypothetical protein
MRPDTPRPVPAPMRPDDAALARLATARPGGAAQPAAAAAPWPAR